MKKDSLNYELISKYRSVLMGVAIIFIMFCHLDIAFSRNGLSASGLSKALHVFTVGVDMFLFLSGVGLYFSYAKKPVSYGEFVSKRMIRLLPLYFILGGVTYSIYDLIIQKLGFGKFLRDLFFVSWLAGDSTKYWYIFAITVFYLLFIPLFQWIHGRERGKLKTLIFCVVWWIIEALMYVYIPAVGNFHIALARLPIFVIGVFCGKLVYEKRNVSVGTTVFALLAGYLAFIALKLPIIRGISSYLYYPVRALLGISIMVTLIMVMELLQKKASKLSDGLKSVFTWFGGLTLELYLLHQSYMILFEYPYKLWAYAVVAFLLPTITAAAIYIFRKKMKGMAA